MQLLRECAKAVKRILLLIHKIQMSILILLGCLSVYMMRGRGKSEIAIEGVKNMAYNSMDIPNLTTQ